MSAREKAQALVDEGIEESFDDAVGALADMGEISQSSADRLFAQESRRDAEEVAGEAAYFDRISRTSEIRGFNDPSPLDAYDPEEAI